jgi:DUF1680 family protein
MLATLAVEVALSIDMAFTAITAAPSLRDQSAAVAVKVGSVLISTGNGTKILDDVVLAAKPHPTVELALVATLGTKQYL